MSKEIKVIKINQGAYKLFDLILNDLIEKQKNNESLEEQYPLYFVLKKIEVYMRNISGYYHKEFNIPDEDYTLTQKDNENKKTINNLPIEIVRFNYPKSTAELYKEIFLALNKNKEHLNKDEKVILFIVINMISNNLMGNNASLIALKIVNELLEEYPDFLPKINSKYLYNVNRVRLYYSEQELSSIIIDKELTLEIIKEINRFKELLAVRILEQEKTRNLFSKTFNSDNEENQKRIILEKLKNLFKEENLVPRIYKTKQLTKLEKKELLSKLENMGFYIEQNFGKYKILKLNENIKREEDTIVSLNYISKYKKNKFITHLFKGYETETDDLKISFIKKTKTMILIEIKDKTEDKIFLNKEEKVNNAINNMFVNIIEDLNKLEEKTKYQMVDLSLNSDLFDVVLKNCLSELNKHIREIKLSTLSKVKRNDIIKAKI